MFDIEGADDLSAVAARARVWCRLGNDAAGHLAQIDPTELTSADLRDLTIGIEALRRLADAAEAHTLAELDTRHDTARTSGHSTSRWLAHRCGLPAGVARRRLVVANQLAELLPEVDAALSAGRIGFDHAAVFADVVNERNHTALTPMLDDLIDAATGTVFSRWRANLTALAALLDPDGAHDPHGDLAVNTLTLSPSNGFMLLRGELAGETALSVHDTLNAIADELFHQHTRDAQATNGATSVPPRSTLLALALEEICRRALATDPNTTTKPRVEATITIHTAPNSDHLDIRGLQHHLLGPIPAATLPTFLCDATFHAALINSLGLPIDIGRATRTTTPAQRRALTIRDGGCTFPGCDSPPAWTDAHHLQHRQHGGPTDMHNLTLLCRRHHRVAHRTGWTITLTNDGWTHWTTPDGHTQWGQQHHHQRAGP